MLLPDGWESCQRHRLRATLLLFMQVQTSMTLQVDCTWKEKGTVRGKIYSTGQNACSYFPITLLSFHLSSSINCAPKKGQEWVIVEKPRSFKKSAEVDVQALKNNLNQNQLGNLSPTVAMSRISFPARYFMLCRPKGKSIFEYQKVTNVSWKVSLKSLQLTNQSHWKQNISKLLQSHLRPRPRLLPLYVQYGMFPTPCSFSATLLRSCHSSKSCFEAQEDFLWE